MAKAALEALNGFNLYGDQGASWSVVYVDVVRIKISSSNLLVYTILGCT
jgi:hypothetical protein